MSDLFQSRLHAGAGFAIASLTGTLSLSFGTVVGLSGAGLGWGALAAVLTCASGLGLTACLLLEQLQGSHAND